MDYRNQICRIKHRCFKTMNETSTEFAAYAILSSTLISVSNPLELTDTLHKCWLALAIKTPPT
jgi:predicted metal-binding protein